MGWPTAQTVAAQAAVELGLVQSAAELGDDVYASTDGNLVQLVALLKRCGRELVDEADWTHLRQEFGILTNQTWGAYILPSDWRNMIDQSGWNRTNRLPLGGPLSEQQWQYLASRLTGVVLNILIRPMQGVLQLYPPTGTPSRQSIVMAYKSSWWVQAAAKTPATYAPSTGYRPGTLVQVANAAAPYAANIYRCVTPGTSSVDAADTPGGTSGAAAGTGPIEISATGDKMVWNWAGFTANVSTGGLDSVLISSVGFGDTPSAGADVLMFVEELLVAKLKHLWLTAKGFATDSSDYDAALERAKGNDAAAPKLNMGISRGIAFDPLLGPQNFPITGFGG